MANVTTGRFLRAEDTNFAVTNLLRVVQVSWCSNAASAIVADSDLTLTDGEDNQIINVRCETDPAGPITVLGPFPPEDPFVLNGLKVTALDAGYLHVVLRDDV